MVEEMIQGTGGVIWGPMGGREDDQSRKVVGEDQGDRDDLEDGSL